MARKIRIAVMSGSRDIKGKSTAVDTYRGMQDYWLQEFENVIYDNPDYIVLPESCDRVLDIDESIRLEYHELRQQKTVEFFSGLAREFNSGIVFNANINNRNTSFAVKEDGEIAGVYNKVFPMTTEMYEGIKPGKEAVVFEYGKIKRAGFAICFDLNFNELMNEYVALKPEVMFFSSMYHGGLVQKTWAYSTRSFFVSSICGRESAVTAPNGRVVARSTNYTDFCVADINLDSELIHLDFNREKFGDIKKKYGEGVIIDDIGYLGSALISCELTDKSMDDIVAEFELIRLDDYFDFARSERKKYL
jgi:predicted amidohydrolase